MPPGSLLQNRIAQTSPAGETHSQQQLNILASNRLTATLDKTQSDIKETKDSIAAVDDPEFLNFVYDNGSGNLSGAAGQYTADKATAAKASATAASAEAGLRAHAAAVGVESTAGVGTTATDGDAKLPNPVGSKKAEESEDEPDDDEDANQ